MRGNAHARFGERPEETDRPECRHRASGRLHRAVFETRGHHGRLLLAGWLAWARRSRIPAFTKLAATVDRYRQLIFNTLDDGGVSNARTEATNTHLRVLTRRSYGFHSPEALIAMAMLTRGGLCPNLPGRTTQLST